MPNGDIDFHSVNHQMSLMIAPLIVLLLTVSLGYLANRVALHKGRNQWAWTIATVILIFPLLILLILPNVTSNDASNTQNA